MRTYNRNFPRLPSRKLLEESYGKKLLCVRIRSRQHGEQLGLLPANHRRGKQLTRIVHCPTSNHTSVTHQLTTNEPRRRDGQRGRRAGLCAGSAKSSSSRCSLRWAASCRAAGKATNLNSRWAASGDRFKSSASADRAVEPEILSRCMGMAGGVLATRKCNSPAVHFIFRNSRNRLWTSTINSTRTTACAQPLQRVRLVMTTARGQSPNPRPVAGCHFAPEQALKLYDAPSG